MAEPIFFIVKKLINMKVLKFEGSNKAKAGLEFVAMEHLIDIYNLFHKEFNIIYTVYNRIDLIL